jgi:hypothetical protein
VGEQLEMEEIPRSLLLPFFIFFFEKGKTTEKTKKFGYNPERVGAHYSTRWWYLFSFFFVGGEKRRRKDA